MSADIKTRLRQAVADGFAKMGSIDFTSLLRMSVQIDYKGLRQCTFGEYVSELPNPTCVSLVTMSPLKGYALVHVDLGLGFVFSMDPEAGSEIPRGSTITLYVI